MGLENWNFVQEPSASNYEGNDYSEALGSGSLSSVPGNPGVTRQFYVRYDVLPAFLDDLQGYATVLADGVTISRVLPDRHPIWANMWVSEATVDPIGPISIYPTKDLALYPLAKVTARYASPTYKIIPDSELAPSGSAASPYRELDRFVTREYAFSGDYITINSAGMMFVSSQSTKALSQPPVKPTSLIELTYTWHMVPPRPTRFPKNVTVYTPERVDPYISENGVFVGPLSAFVPPNLSQLLYCVGKVNRYTFDPYHFNAPPGTILFAGVDPQMRNYRLTTGDDESNIFWDIKLKFLYRCNKTNPEDANFGSGGVVAQSNASFPQYFISEYAGHNFFWDQARGRLAMFKVKCALTNGGNNITVLGSLQNIEVGDPVGGPGIQDGTTVSSINTTNKIVTLSLPVTLTGQKSIAFKVYNDLGWWDLLTRTGDARGARLTGQAVDLNNLFGLTDPAI